jgi:Flp pilus assembly protein TadD
MSRSSVFGFKGKDVLPVDVGRKLGVDAVLAGEVEQHGDQIRVSAELVTVRDGAVVWGQAYERAIDDALAIQDKISREVLATLRATLSAEEKAKVGRQPTDDPDAYREYLNGRFAVAHQLKGRALCSKGDWRVAISELRRAVELGSGKSSESIGFLGVAYAKSGDRAKALEQIRMLSQGLGTNPTLAYPIAKVHAALGERDEALLWLEKARGSHSWHLVELQVEPAFDPIRDDPRFEALVKTVGFAR